MFRTHWWSRPQWEGVHQRLAWYLLPDQAVRAAVGGWQARLAAPHLDPVPLPWLHVTVEALAADPASLPDGTVPAIASSARARLADRAPFEATCDRLEVWEEGVVWLVEPAPALAGLRHALLAATADRLPVEPSPPYVAHLSLAYANTTAPDDAARAAVAGAGPGPSFTVADAALVALRREGHRYVWDELARVRLGG